MEQGASDGDRRPPPLPPVSYLAANGWSLGLVLAYLPVWVIVVSALDLESASWVGAGIGWGAAFLDAAISGIFQRGAVEKIGRTATGSGGFGFLGGSFGARLLVLVAAALVFTRQVEGVSATAFLLCYVPGHLLALGGVIVVLQKRLTQARVARQEAKANAKAAAEAQVGEQTGPKQTDETRR